MTVMLLYEFWQQAFIQNDAEPVQRLTYQLLVPQPFQYFTEAVESLDFETFRVPVSYVFSADDFGMPPGEYQRHAARLGVTPSPAPGSHEVFFTQPEGLAQALQDAPGHRSPRAG